MSRPSSKPKRVHRRTDPRAAILSDWFGIKNLAALVLVALYDAPASQADLADQLGNRAIQQSLSELRAAGVPIPTVNKWHPVCSIGDAGRAQVREAFANALKALGREVPTPDALENALTELRGDTHTRHAAQVMALQDAFGVYACTARLLLALHRLAPQAVSVARLNAIIPARVQDPEPKRINVIVRFARRALGDDAIETVYGFGYRLSAVGRQSVEAALANLHPPA